MGKKKPSTPNDFSEAPLAQSLIDQAIDEYKSGETLACRFAITLFIVGIGVIIYGAWTQQGLIAVAGSATTALFLPAMNYLSRVRREKSALRLLQYPLSLASNSQQAAELIQEFFIDAFKEGAKK